MTGSSQCLGLTCGSSFLPRQEGSERAGRVLHPGPHRQPHSSAGTEPRAGDEPVGVQKSLTAVDG